MCAIRNNKAVYCLPSQHFLFINWGTNNKRGFSVFLSFPPSFLLASLPPSLPTSLLPSLPPFPSLPPPPFLPSLSN